MRKNPTLRSLLGLGLLCAAPAVTQADLVTFNVDMNGITNSAGQRIVDAHTTDHYHVYWKLGSSKAQYRFARVQPQWVIGVGAPPA